MTSTAQNAIITNHRIFINNWGIFQNHFQNVGYLDKINSTIYQ